jgi:hypothetical protein
MDYIIGDRGRERKDTGFITCKGMIFNEVRSTH